MKSTITRDEAWKLLNKYAKKPETIMHMRETEVIMRGLAHHFGEDEDLWGNTGLLHDLDLDICKKDFSDHSKKTIEILKEEGYEIPEMFQAILSHTEKFLPEAPARKSKLDFAHAAGENISGFIYACALMRPSKLDGMKVKSVTKKLKDKKFAAKVNREFINDIEKTGIDRAKFLQIAIEAMQSIKDEIFR